MSLPQNKNLFKEFPNRVGVETGSYRGDGIQAFIDAGYEKIISIDIDPENTAFCRSRFAVSGAKGEKIELITGDSSLCLWNMIKDIKEPIVLWLDSHSQLLEGEILYGKPFPLLDELKQIQAHPIKNHTLVVDDILHLSHPDVTGWTKHQIEEAVRNINPDYKIEYVANPVVNNILIASL